jgi:hypothetical protein
LRLKNIQRKETMAHTIRAATPKPTNQNPTTGDRMKMRTRRRRAITVSGGLPDSWFENRQPVNTLFGLFPLFTTNPL